jgi:hypothetical protein
MLTQLRKNFPATVTSETVKKLGIASNNESYVINALRFIGIIDEEGKKTQKGTDVFSIHKDDDFKAAFEGLIRGAYKDLFDLRGDDVWKMDREALVNYFRTTDKTSAAIGGRQAGVFQMFASYAGHGEVDAKARPATKGTSAKSNKTKTSAAGVTKSKPKVEPRPRHGDGSGALKRDMALTVRIEINLPADGTRETYDHIFQSIKANLLNE